MGPDQPRGADEAFAAEVDALVARLAAGPTRAYAGAKRQLNAWSAGHGRPARARGAIQQEMAGSADFVEGVAAFVEKRRAAFGGR